MYQYLGACCSFYGTIVPQGLRGMQKLCRKVIGRQGMAWGGCITADIGVSGHGVWRLYVGRSWILAAGNALPAF